MVKMLRKILLKLARGVAREEVMLSKISNLIRVDRPIIKMARQIGPWEYRYLPLDEIISYTKQKMAQEIGEKMAENGMINFTVKMPDVKINALFGGDPEKELCIITAEVWAAKGE